MKHIVRKKKLTAAEVKRLAKERKQIEAEFQGALSVLAFIAAGGHPKDL